MRVFISGAAGRMGMATGNALAAEGCQVFGCDLRPASGACFPIRLGDLRGMHSDELRGCLAGTDVLVHFAGYASAKFRAPAGVFEHNAALDARLLEAAVAAGLRTVVFASSIAVMNGESGLESDAERFRPASLPLDGDAAPVLHPANPYARAKRSTEELLERLALAHPGRSFVALRFPWVVDRRLFPYASLRPRARGWARQAFCFLPLEEVARVVSAVVSAAIPGYRCYFPAARENLFFEPARLVAARELPGVPVSVPPEDFVALAHDRRLEAETGWRPGPVVCVETARPRAVRRLSRWWRGGLTRLARVRDNLGVPVLDVARVASRTAASLGEGPCWDERAGCIHWVDIEAGELHRFYPADGSARRVALGQATSAVAASNDGRLLVALQESLAWVDFQTDQVTPHAAGRMEGPPNRFNDGKCDAAGRFWIGSMSLNWGERRAALFCVEPEGRVRRVLEDVACSNGLGWSPDGRAFYYIDSGNRALEAFDFDRARGELTRRRVVFAFAARRGVPDGLCVDANGLVWVALNGGGQVVQVDPVRGRVVGCVRVPTSRVTACAFGGADLCDLFITTARDASGSVRGADDDEAGSLFVARPGPAGLPAFKWASRNPAGA